MFEKLFEQMSLFWVLLWRKTSRELEFWDKCSLYERWASFIRSNVPGKGHSPTRATPRLSEPNFHTFPYKTCRTFYMRTKKKVGPAGKVTLLSQNARPARRVTLPAGTTFLHINTLARTAGQTRSRQDNKRIRKCCWLGQRGQICFLSFKRSLKLTRLWLPGGGRGGKRVILLSGTGYLYIWTGP